MADSLNQFAQDIATGALRVIDLTHPLSDEFPALQLPPRSYVAVTKKGAEVAIGMANAEEVASFHVIVGRW